MGSRHGPLVPALGHPAVASQFDVLSSRDHCHGPGDTRPNRDSRSPGRPRPSLPARRGTECNHPRLRRRGRRRGADSDAHDRPRSARPRRLYPAGGVHPARRSAESGRREQSRVQRRHTGAGSGDGHLVAREPERRLHLHRERSENPPAQTRKGSDLPRAASGHVAGRRVPVPAQRPEERRPAAGRVPAARGEARPPAGAAGAASDGRRSPYAGATRECRAASPAACARRAGASGSATSTSTTSSSTRRSSTTVEAGEDLPVDSATRSNSCRRGSASGAYARSAAAATSAAAGGP